jgi:hypothetical protein
MFQLLELRKFLERFALLVSAIAIIIWVIRKPDKLLEMAETISLAGLISVSMLAFVGQTGVFHFLWRKPFIQKRFFPYIPGTYEGTISSNWSVISAIRAGATGSGGLSDADLHVEKLGHFPKSVTVEIKASLFQASMKLIPKDAYTDSQTVWLRPVREGEAGHPRLYYMYRSTTQNAPKATDVQFHFGAAYVDVVEHKGKLSLRGVYWTDRDWPHGRNTAGELNATKL